MSSLPDCIGTNPVGSGCRKEGLWAEAIGQLGMSLLNLDDTLGSVPSTAQT